MKKNIRSLFGGDFRQFGMIAALLLIVVFFQWRTGGKVLQSQNLMNLISGNAYVLILAMGMVLVIIAGHIDLAVGSVAAFVGIIVAKLAADYGLPPFVALLGGLAVGFLVGSWHGFWVAKWGVPAFIATLAGQMLFRGANQLIGHSLTVPVPKFFQTLGAGYLPDIAPDVLPFNLPTMLIAVLGIVALAWGELRKRRQQIEVNAELAPVWVPVVRVAAIGAVLLWIMWLFATGRPGTSFPIPGVIVVILMIVFSFVANRTVLGRSVYAIGGNRAAAALTGIRVQRTNFVVMCTSSVLAAVAAMVFIGRSTASGPADGTGWELDAIAACFIGGASVWGGIGTIGGTMVGALVMAFLNNGLQLMGVGSDWTQIIKGLVLLLAVAADVYSKRQGKRSLIGTFQNARRNQRQILETEKALAEGKAPTPVPNTDSPVAEAVADEPSVFVQTPGDTPQKE
ncbi:MAG: sugar ABC transporter permease [Propionibacterium sp.]|nr:sugar ABC transporter permease [Propionibacterium sp.]